MDFISASLGTVLDEIYQRNGMEDSELQMLTVALLDGMGREGRGDGPHRSGVDTSFRRVKYRQEEQKSAHALATWRDVLN